MILDRKGDHMCVCHTSYSVMLLFFDAFMIAVKDVLYFLEGSLFLRSIDNLKIIFVHFIVLFYNI